MRVEMRDGKVYIDGTYYSDLSLDAAIGRAAVEKGLVPGWDLTGLNSPKDCEHITWGRGCEERIKVIQHSPPPDRLASVLEGIPRTALAVGQTENCIIVGSPTRGCYVTYAREGRPATRAELFEVACLICRNGVTVIA